MGGSNHFGDLFDESCRVTPLKMTHEERVEFVRGLQRRMDENGFTRANEITAQAEVLTAEDYGAVINVRPDYVYR